MIALVMLFIAVYSVKLIFLILILRREGSRLRRGSMYGLGLTLGVEPVAGIVAALAFLLSSRVSGGLSSALMAITLGGLAIFVIADAVGAILCLVDFVRHRQD